MSDPTPADSNPVDALLEARRTFQDRFSVLTAAYSVDGRGFSFFAPIGAELEAGGFVRMDLRDGSTLIGLIQETGTESLDST
ncbi:MAG: hypothetical protein WBA46_16325, partial [Thermomicrobiales bacterium]